MNKTIGILPALLIVSAGFAFAGGQKDSGTTQAAAATTGMVEKGPVRYYATPADYEKATGKKLEGYSEAPMLAELVKAGKIPAVEQRLPAEPLVVKPYEEIGTYGGTAVSSTINPINTDECWTARQQPLLMISLHEPYFMPNIVKGWELSSDLKTWTIFLRKDHKWSDGAPFTADDFLFFYEDILKNDELSPQKHFSWRIGGELMQMVKDDDYTVRFIFAAPNPPIVARQSTINRFNNQIPYAPRHFLTQ